MALEGLAQLWDEHLRSVVQDGIQALQNALACTIQLASIAGSDPATRMRRTADCGLQLQAVTVYAAAATHGILVSMATKLLARPQTSFLLLPTHGQCVDLVSLFDVVACRGFDHTDRAGAQPSDSRKVPCMGCPQG